MSDQEVKQVVVKSEGEVIGYQLGYAFGLPLLAAILGGAITYKIFGTEMTGWIGAALGFGASMLSTEIRNAFLEGFFKVVAVIVGLAIVVGIIWFAGETFST